jgi:hypothetical protein
MNFSPTTLARALMLAGISVAIGWLVYAADRPEARYTRNLSCHYNTIFRESGDVDVVSIGSSRALRAISGPHGGTLLGEALGRDAVWLDLSRSWRGRGQIYRQVVDTLDNRDVDTLLVEYFPDSRYYGRYAKTATALDLIEDIVISEHLSMYERIAFSMRTAMLKYASFLTALVYEPRGLIIRKPKRSQSVDCITGESPLKKAKLAVRLKSYPVPATSPQKDWAMDAPSEARNSGYIEKIIASAQQKGVKIYFFKVPLLNEGPLSDAMSEGFRARFGVELLNMNYTQANGLFATPNNYGDATHMRDGGRRYYTAWLTSELLARAGKH